MEKRFRRGFDERERGWCPEVGVLANCGGGGDGTVVAREAEMACEVGTAQDKHGREGVAKMRTSEKRRERESGHSGWSFGLIGPSKLAGFFLYF